MIFHFKCQTQILNDGAPIGPLKIVWCDRTLRFLSVKPPRLVHFITIGALIVHYGSGSDKKSVSAPVSRLRPPATGRELATSRYITARIPPGRPSTTIATRVIDSFRGPFLCLCALEPLCAHVIRRRGITRGVPW